MDCRSLFAGSLATIAGLRLSLAPLLFLVIVWGESSPGGQGARVGAAKSCSECRARSRAPGAGRRAGAPADPARRPPGRFERVRLLLQVRREDREARNFLPPPALYLAFSATRLSSGALATLCALVALRGGATFSHQLWAAGACCARTLLLGLTPRTLWSLGVFFDDCLPFFLSQCPSASHSLCASLSLTQFLSLTFSLTLAPPAPSGSVSFPFFSSLSFLGCLFLLLCLLTLVSSPFSLPLAAYLCLPSSPLLSSRSSGALASGARPYPPSGHLQVQRSPYSEPESVRGMPLCGLSWSRGAE